MVIILQNSGVTLRTLPVIFMLLAGYVTALAQEPVRVKIADLGDIAVYPERSAPATVISLNNTMVSAEIRAVVTDIPVNVGEVVEKGDVLLNLDCDEYNYMRSEAAAQIDALKARIKLAELKLARTEELLLKQSIAEETRDERDSELSVLRSDIRASQSRLNNAKLDVDRCTIESPFRALIKKRMASIGQFASVGTELLEIVDLDTLELSAQIFSQDTHQLHKANELMFEHNNEYYPLTIKKIVPAINTETRNQEVRLLFYDRQALPGTSGKLIWKDNQPHLPGKYVVSRGNQSGYFYVNDDNAHFQSIDGASAGRTTPINTKNNDRVIIEGYFGLQDGMPVLIED